MGLISDKKMLPTIIFEILWKYTDEDHYLSQDELVNKVLEVYQPKESTSDESNKRLIVSDLNSLSDYLLDIQKYGYSSSGMLIETVSLKDRFVSGNIKGYHLINRPFNDVDIRMLCDSVLFSPGMTDEHAREMNSKIVMLASENFKNVYQYIHTCNLVQKTENPDVIENIEVIGKAIEKKRRVVFVYRGKEVNYNPYYLVVYSGRYYCIGNHESYDYLSHYRLDRMKSCKFVDEKVRDIASISDGMYQGKFSIENYIRMHPRMSVDKVVSITLNVREQFLDTVKQEFMVCQDYPQFMCEEGIKKIRITSCKAALCNWLINVPDLAWVDYDDASGVIEELVRRASQVLTAYSNNNE